MRTRAPQLRYRSTRPDSLPTRSFRPRHTAGKARRFGRNPRPRRASQNLPYRSPIRSPFGSHRCSIRLGGSDFESVFSNRPEIREIVFAQIGGGCLRSTGGDIVRRISVRLTNVVQEDVTMGAMFVDIIIREMSRMLVNIEVAGSGCGIKRYALLSYGTYPSERDYSCQPSKTVPRAPRSRARLWRSCTRRPSECPPGAAFPSSTILGQSKAVLRKQNTVPLPRSYTRVHV